MTENALAGGVRILCVDNYDSFVYTIVSYLRQLGAGVDVMRNDTVDMEALERCTWRGVLVSPGPSSPSEAGRSLEVIDACARLRLPMLGVCLGHQALGQWAGAAVVHAPTLMHGRTSSIHHDGRGIFRDLPSPLTVTRYHSLAVEPTSVPAQLQVSARTEDGVIMGLRHRLSLIHI